MTLILSGTDGLSDVDGTAATPALRGTDANTGIFFPAADTIAFAEGGAEAMRITSTGDVGIGTSSPNARLEALSSTAGAEIARFEGNYSAAGTVNLTNWRRSGGAVASVMRYNDANTTMEFGATTSHPQAFITSGTERMRITSGGAVRIGGSFTSGASKLGVNNTNNVSGDQSTTFELGTNCNNTSSYHLICVTGTNDKLYIYGNGNVQNTNNSYGAISDIKLKENIVDATPKLADLMQVRVRNYNLIGDTTKQIGVVAQELETVFPALVDESPDRNQEGNNLGATTKSVKYSVFVPMLIKAIQEQQALITALTTRITALEAA